MPYRIMRHCPRRPCAPASRVHGHVRARAHACRPTPQLAHKEIARGRARKGEGERGKARESERARESARKGEREREQDSERAREQDSERERERERRRERDRSNAVAMLLSRNDGFISLLQPILLVLLLYPRHVHDASAHISSTWRRHARVRKL